MDNESATFEALQLRLEIDNNGSKRYYNHKNQLHKIHGPAIEWADGRKEWWINDEKLTKAKFLKHPLCTIK